jgi:hypothetical protein
VIERMLIMLVLCARSRRITRAARMRSQQASEPQTT